MLDTICYVVLHNHTRIPGKTYVFFVCVCSCLVVCVTFSRYWYACRACVCPNVQTPFVVNEVHTWLVYEEPCETLVRYFAILSIRKYHSFIYIIPGMWYWHRASHVLYLVYTLMYLWFWKTFFFCRYESYPLTFNNTFVDTSRIHLRSFRW